MTDPETPIRDQVRELEAREQRARELTSRLRALPPDSVETRRLIPALAPAPPEAAEPPRAASAPAPLGPAPPDPASLEPASLGPVSREPADRLDQRRVAPAPAPASPPAPEPPAPADARRLAPPPAPPAAAEPRRIAPPSPSAPRPTGRELAPRQLHPGLERALAGIRAALPLVQKVLPILDGQFLTALSNLLGPHPTTPPPADLSPLEAGLADLRLRHIELFSKVGEQNTALKRVVERLEKVQDAAERNAQEQQDLKDEIKAVGRKANAVAIAALALLAVSLAVNVFLFLHFAHAAR